MQYTASHHQSQESGPGRGTLEPHRSLLQRLGKKAKVKHDRQREGAMLFCFAKHSFMLFNGWGKRNVCWGGGPKAPPRWHRQGGRSCLRSFQRNCWEEPSLGWCPGPWAGVSLALSSSPTTALEGLPDPPAHLTPPPQHTHTSMSQHSV